MLILRWVLIPDGFSGSFPVSSHWSHAAGIGKWDYPFSTQFVILTNYPDRKSGLKWVSMDWQGNRSVISLQQCRNHH
jgi:hypothetical protein